MEQKEFTVISKEHPNTSLLTVVFDHDYLLKTFIEQHNIEFDPETMVIRHHQKTQYDKYITLMPIFVNDNGKTTMILSTEDLVVRISRVLTETLHDLLLSLDWDIFNVFTNVEIFQYIGKLICDIPLLSLPFEVPDYLWSETEIISDQEFMCEQISENFFNVSETNKQCSMTAYAYWSGFENIRCEIFGGNVNETVSFNNRYL